MTTSNLKNSNPPCTLSLQRGRLHARLPDATEDVAVRVVYLRPLSTRRELVLLTDDDQELLTFELDALQPPCRALATAALQERYHMPRITSVEQVATLYGAYYWTVQTDKGPRRFAIKEPGKNVTWIDDHRLILRDTAGNRYEITGLSDLDPASRRCIEIML